MSDIQKAKEVKSEVFKRALDHVLFCSGLKNKLEGPIDVGLIYKLRDQLMALLNSKKGIKKILSPLYNRIRKMLDPLSYVGKLYNYTPPPNKAGNIDLGIKWSEFDNQSLIDQFKDENYDDEPLSVQLPSDASTVIYSTMLGQKKEVIKLNLKKMVSGVGYNVAHFEALSENSEEAECVEWNMHQREVDNAYRNQGIATKLINQFEQILSNCDQPQLLTFELAQANLLILLMKLNFVPYSDADAQNIDRFLSGDDNLIIVSVPPEAKVANRPEWYIFEKEKYFDKEGQVYPYIWERDEGRGPTYIQDSFRIKMKKKIT